MFASYLMSTAQLVVNFTGNADVNPGDQISVDVSVDDFDDIFLFQFGVLWDASVVSFNSVTNVTSALSSFSEAANIGTSTNAPSQFDDGEIWLTWNAPGANGETIPDGTILFTIVLDVTGDPCDETSFTAGEFPPDRLIEVFDSSLSTNLGVTSNDSSVNIDGNDCNGTGGGDDLTIIASEENAEPGENVCVVVTVENFVNVQSAQAGLTWDPAIIQYTGVQNFGDLPGLMNLFNVNNVNAGEINFLWFDNSGSNPVTLADGATIFEICFDAVGSVGDCAPVEFANINGNIEFSDGSGQTLDFDTDDGKVTITGPTVDPLVISISDESGAPGENVCVDYTVQEFNNIGSMQWSIVFDNSVLAYTGPAMTNGTIGITNFSFNPQGDNSVVFTWNEPNGGGASLPDGSLIFKVCFDLVGSCEESAEVIFSDSPISVEIADGNADEIPSSLYELNDGAISVVCAKTINAIINPIDCFGGEGDITTTGAEGCDCEWTSGGIVQSNSCNLFSKTAGIYTLVVSQNGMTVFTEDYTLVDPPQLVVSATATNAACGMNGSVIVNSSGGTAPYDTPVFTPTITDVNNVPVGDYSVSVMDMNDCPATTTFSITTELQDLSVMVETTNPSCFDSNDGTLLASPSGGCPPYMCSVSGTSCADAMLGAGNYTLTIEDGNGETVTADFVLVAPTQPSVSLVGNIGESSGMNGFVNVSGSGGTGAYTFAWTGPNGFTSNTQNILGLAPGEYCVVISDANNCMGDASCFIVPGETNPEAPEINVLGITQISCFGLGADCDGIITYEIVDKGTPFMVTVNNVVTTETELTGLCAGTYTIVVTDDNGLTNTVIRTITEPEAIMITVDTVLCAASFDDGTIMLDVTGGTGEYSFDWSPDGMGEDPTFLAPGNYNVDVTDENGCVAINDAPIIVPVCPIVGDCNGGACFEDYTSIITPNRDGANDVFSICCSERNPNTLGMYDRYGRLVFNTTNYTGGWEGINNNGTELPEGAYMWVLSVDFPTGETRIYQGTVTILRN